MEKVKRQWTQGEKWLWATPLLLGIIAVSMMVGPKAIRQRLGWPEILITTPTNVLINVVVSRDGSLLAATGRDDGKASSGTVYLWDAQTLKPLISLAPQLWKSSRGIVNGWILSALSLSPDGKLIGVAERGAEGFGVYEVGSQKLLWHTPISTEYSQFSADGRFVALSEFGNLRISETLGQFELRDARIGKVMTHWKAPNGSELRQFSLAPDGKIIAWIGRTTPRKPQTYHDTPRQPDGKAIEIRRLSDGKVLRVLPDSQETESVEFSSDGQKIVSLAQGELNSGAQDGSVVRCYSSIGKLLWKRDFRRSKQKKGSPYIFGLFLSDALFSPDGNTIVVRDMGESRVLILNAADGSDKQPITLGKEQYSRYTGPRAVNFSPDSKRLFVRGNSGVIVWDLP